MKEELKFIIIYGVPGKVEFDSFQEAWECCKKGNGAAVYDADVKSLILNKGFRPELVERSLERRRRDRVLELMIYGLTILVIGIYLFVLVSVR